MEFRRRRVAALNLRGLSVREILRVMADPEGTSYMVNPLTAKPYGLGTIARDMVELKKRWRKEAGKDFAEHKARQLAELTEHRRASWADKDRSEVRLGIALEMKLVGTESPTKIEQEITLTQKKVGGLAIDDV